MAVRGVRLTGCVWGFAGLVGRGVGVGRESCRGWLVGGHGNCACMKKIVDRFEILKNPVRLAVAGGWAGAQ
jgi:hypothetical protein